MSINHDYIVPSLKSKQSKNEDNPLKRCSISGIFGPTGSGKSTLLMNLLIALDDLHDFDSALFVSSNLKDPLLDAIEMPKTNSPADLEDFIVKTMNSQEATKHLLILDDIQGSSDFNVMRSRSLFTNFVLSHRHYGESKKDPNSHGVWVIFTGQTIKNSMAPTIRDQMKNVFIYYPRNPKELLNIIDFAQDPIAMKRAMRLVKGDGNYQFLFLNRHDKTRDRYFLGFDKEITDLNGKLLEK